VAYHAFEEMTPMCANHLAVLYRLYLDRGASRIALIEEDAEIDVTVLLTEDDRRNEPVHYERLFSRECLGSVLNLYVAIKKRIKSCSYEEAADPLIALAFLQEIVATALWKYELDPSEGLTEFAREFDRLDIEAERIRLYELIAHE
jgi:hypothetical protein